MEGKRVLIYVAIALGLIGLCRALLFAPYALAGVDFRHTCEAVVGIVPLFFLPSTFRRAYLFGAFLLAGAAGLLVHLGNTVKCRTDMPQCIHGSASLAALIFYGLLLSVGLWWYGTSSPRAKMRHADRRNVE